MYFCISWYQSCKHYHFQKIFFYEGHYLTVLCLSFYQERNEDDDFESAQEDSSDDEETIQEQEKDEANVDHEKELKELEVNILGFNINFTS